VERIVRKKEKEIRRQNSGIKINSNAIRNTIYENKKEEIEMFKGSLVAMITPFTKNDEVDEKGIKELVEFHIKNGTNGIVPCGTTGESPTLSHEEHKRVVELTIKAVAGRVPVIAGAGSNCTREALDLTSHAKETGADGALIITPYYNKPTPVEI